MDIRYMKRALALARKGIGHTSPNPAVGCVIVKNGQIVGEGWHKKAGGHHAEIHALNNAGEASRGADVYVTLEPCCHTGKTPPCVDALIAAGIKRVYAGMTDPNPLVAGKGIATLQNAGIEAFTGILERECQAINKPFIKYVTTGLPYIIYKCAMTLDGKIATVTGESRWISGEQSRKFVHKMRSTLDAVMVGVDTIIADNPQLTVRHIKGRNPLRIIVDSTLRTPESVSVLSGKLAHKTIIATTEQNPRVHLRYSQSGAKIIVCNADAGRVDLLDLLKKLAKEGIQSILLEGGSRLAGDALRHGLIDECIFFYAPKVIGSDGFSPFAITGITSMNNSIRFLGADIKRMGEDLVVTAYPEKKTCSPV